MTLETNDRLTRLIEGAGPANPFRKALTPSRPEEGALDANEGFHGLENPSGGLPGPTMDGPPYTVKDGALKLFHAVKQAFHAHQRMAERTPFKKGYVDELQKAVDMLPLEGPQYHVPLRTKDGVVAGWAQFKRVPNRTRPVLATVLGPNMVPNGPNIEAMLKSSSAPGTNDAANESGLFDTDHIDPRPPESTAWNRRHQHLFSREIPNYALNRAFDGVSTQPAHEVIEDGIAPAQTADLW
jgi:hypothetical protein